MIVRKFSSRLFPPTLPRPVRVEFFGDEVESLRTFDQETQRSLNPIALCIVGPAREALPVRGPEAVKELEQFNSNRMLYRDAEERWAAVEDAAGARGGAPGG